VEFDQRAISDAELYRQAMETEFNMRDAGGNAVSLPNCGTQPCSGTCKPSTYCGIGGLSYCGSGYPYCVCWTNAEGYPRCFDTSGPPSQRIHCIQSSLCPSGQECAAGFCDSSVCMPLCA
jgi:hypothetical protein